MTTGKPQSLDDIHFNIGEVVRVDLVNGFFYDSHSQSREVNVVSGNQMGRTLRGEEKSTKSEIRERYAKSSFVPAGVIVGDFAGSRPGLIKVKPYHGFKFPEAEYFVVYESQIKSVQRLEETERKISVKGK